MSDCSVLKNKAIRKLIDRCDQTEREDRSRSRRLIGLASKAPSAVACFGALIALLFILTLDARADEGTKTGNRAASAANEYKLGPQDEIRLRVIEWRPSSDEVFEWAPLNANYTIGPTFNLALPLVGQVSVEGLSAGQLGTLLGQKLKARMGLVLPPDVSIEIVKYRPFYVVGHVKTPGGYAYRPGLNVLQAVSLSGGFLRNENASAMRLDRDIAVSQGERELLIGERDTMIARKARIEAEIRGADTIIFPEELKQSPDKLAISRLMIQENLIFNARKKAYETQLTILNELQKYLKKSATSLSAQIEAQNTQLALLKQEQATVDALAQKRLARATRVLGMKRDLAQFEVERLRSQTALSKARQDVSRNEIALVELKNKRQGDLTLELQQADNRLEQITDRMATLEKLLFEAQVTAPMKISEQGKNLGMKSQFKIVRRVEETAVELQASETTALLPGDTLKVELLLPVGGNLMKPNRFNAIPAATLQDTKKHAAFE